MSALSADELMEWKRAGELTDSLVQSSVLKFLSHQLSQLLATVEPQAQQSLLSSCVIASVYIV